MIPGGNVRVGDNRLLYRNLWYSVRAVAVLAPAQGRVSAHPVSTRASVGTGCAERVAIRTGAGYARTVGRVVVVGSLNADLTVRTERLPRPGETVHGSSLVVAPGGKSANQAVAAARLGGSVALLGAVGRDDHADLLLRSLGEAGVDTGAVRRLPGTATGTALITVDRAGENTIVLSAGANGELTPEHLSALPSLLEGAAVLCLCFEIPMATVVAAARLGRQAGACVVLNPSPAAPIPEALLAEVGVLILNETEAAEVGDRGRWPAAIVTRGSEGADVIQEGRATSVPAVPVTPVDTTGAGDAFTGAVAARLAAGTPLLDAARFAARAAAWSTTRPGAQPSYATLADLDGWDPRG